ncbi:fimbrial biogenesis chaperone [Klebsiella michiganensis]|uniref:Molecular chaperone n=1 Tax=Klebsiella michiganensis TaxID=1134687 RepID=A0AB35PQJ3_9ENTR|nr:molecular chaperone [Klebsiella michiganensis]ELG9970567.1 molecular chaperone [Klebsiella michiganensis]KFC40670.1 fimbrial assembly protein [Klebsiella michiganensis]MBG2589149.1 molecular chaperone [Klebsiella michiganensis]MBG2636379.1 molecular chaperone [Klebsiella michiganensis]MBG2681127.1 molecular chaperone [Klebsiella michiganensis]
MKINTFAKGLLFLLGTSFAVNAAVSPDRTRIILNQSDKSVSVRLTNQSTTIPFLAQSWIEDKDNKKSRNYITAVPPMVRLEAGEQVQVRLIPQPTLTQLPADRESLFYFNVREIPPRSEQKNVMQIAMQSRIKIFWRPKAVEVKNGQVNLTGKFDVNRTASGLTLKNNSPYFITVGYIGTNGKTLLPKTSSMMAEPFGLASQEIKDLPANFQVGFIGDYGGLNMFKISCNSVQIVCQSEPVKRG